MTSNDIRTAGALYLTTPKIRMKNADLQPAKEKRYRVEEKSGYSFPFTACWAFFARSFAVYPVTCWR